MIPVSQRIVSLGENTNEIPGDCVKCCVASLLELPYEEVPHFVAGEWLVSPKAVDGVICGEPYRTDWLTSLNDWLLSIDSNLYANNETYWADCPWRSSKLNDRYEQLDSLRLSTPGLWCMGHVISENFEDSTHAVVMYSSDVKYDPSPRTRRTSYKFVGVTTFTVMNPARVVHERALCKEFSRLTAVSTGTTYQNALGDGL